MPWTVQLLCPPALRQVVRLTSWDGSVSGRSLQSSVCCSSRLSTPVEFLVWLLRVRSQAVGDPVCVISEMSPSPLEGQAVCWWGFRKPPAGVAAQLCVLVVTVRYAVVWVWNVRICLVLWLGRCLEGCGSAVVRRCCRVRAGTEGEQVPEPWPRHTAAPCSAPALPGSQRRLRALHPR